MDDWKRELASKDESAADKWKVTTLEEKFVSNIKGIIEEVVGSRNVNTATIWETLDIQPDELSEEFIDMNEQSGCDEKDDDQEEVMPEKKNKALQIEGAVREISRFVCVIESAKDIMWS